MAGGSGTGAGGSHLVMGSGDAAQVWVPRVWVLSWWSSPLHLAPVRASWWFRRCLPKQKDARIKELSYSW